MPPARGFAEGIERAQAAATAWNGPALESILAAAPRLEWLHQRGAGIDGITTNRPGWLRVPLTGLQRILSQRTWI